MSVQIQKTLNHSKHSQRKAVRRLSKASPQPQIFGSLSPKLFTFLSLSASLSPEVEAAYCTNGDPATGHSLSPGVYGLSNQRLDSPWNKVTRGKARFSELVSGLQTGSLDQAECEKQLLDLLCDQTW